MLFKNKKHKVDTVNKHTIALRKDNVKRHVQAHGIPTLTRGYLHKCVHNGVAIIGVFYLVRIIKTNKVYMFCDKYCFCVA